MNSLLDHFDPAEVVANEITCKFIMVTGDINHTATFANAAQEFLDNVIVGLWPIPSAAQLPAVNDIAHQVQRIAGVGA